MKPLFDAICWDHDGLLVDSEYLFFSTTRDVLLEVGVCLSQEHWSDKYLSCGLGTAAVAQGLGVSALQCKALVETRNRLYRESLESSPPLCSAAEDTLRLLHGKLPMALVTGSEREDIDLIHRSTGLLKLFGTIVARSDYDLPKPAPDPYLEAARRLGVPPERCLAVEDSARGLRAAIAAGMRCVVIPGPLTSGQAFEGAYAIEACLDRIPSHVFKAENG
jgi:HAD superfamily hydrolase (TIGR01509 family)